MHTELGARQGGSGGYASCARNKALKAMHAACAHGCAGDSELDERPAEVAKHMRECMHGFVSMVAAALPRWLSEVK